MQCKSDGDNQCEMSVFACVGVCTYLPVERVKPDLQGKLHRVDW